MNHYVLIETQSLSENMEVAGFLKTAVTLARTGNRVDLWLIQNGVLLLVENNGESLEEAKETTNLLLHADDYSLLHRGINISVQNDVKVCSMKELVIHIMRPECKTVWH